MKGLHSVSSQVTSGNLLLPWCGQCPVVGFQQSLRLTTQLAQCPRSEFSPLFEPVDLGYGDLSELQPIGPSLPRSRFSRMPCVSKSAAVLHRLTDFEVSRLECLILGHLRRLRDEATAASRPSLSGNQSLLQGTALCHLVHHRDSLTPQQHDYMLELLREVTIIKDVPEELLCQVSSQVELLTFSSGQKVFEKTHVADGLHILVQGELEVTHAAAPGLGLGVRKCAQCAVCPEDLLDMHSQRPFHLRQEELRLRSTTAALWCVDQPNAVARTLFVPVTVLTRISKHFRDAERRERTCLAMKFASAVHRIALCKAPLHFCPKAFQSVTRHRGFVEFVQGAHPTLDVARVSLIVEGELQLEVEDKQRRRLAKAAKKILGPGSLIGCDVLHGEPYHHTGIWVSAEARLFSVSAAIFLEKLVGADVPLERPTSTPDGCDGESARLHRRREAGWPVAPAVDAFFAASKHVDRTSADIADLKVMHAHLFPLKDLRRR